MRRIEVKLAPELVDAFIRVIDTRTGAELPFTRLRGDRVLIDPEFAAFAAVQELPPARVKPSARRTRL